MAGLRLPEINRVTLGGRLTRDPEVRYASDGTPVASFTLAFHRRWRGRDGRPAEQTGFAHVVAYQRLAQVCGLFLTKGSPVLVEGRLQMREWTTPQGARRERLEVRAEHVHFLEKRSAGETADDEGGGPSGPSGPGGERRSHGQRT